MKARFDVTQLIAKIEHTGDRVVRHAMQGLKNVGEDIAETAAAFAPRDTGALERAFLVSEVRQGRDARGRFGRAAVSVYIDPLARNPDDDKLVEFYGWIMHEELTPYGDFQLGKKSIAKGGEVGGGFIERALEEHLDEIEEAVVNKMREVL